MPARPGSPQSGRIDRAGIKAGGATGRTGAAAAGIAGTPPGRPAGLAPREAACPVAMSRRCPGLDPGSGNVVAAVIRKRRVQAAAVRGGSEASTATARGPPNSVPWPKSTPKPRIRTSFSSSSMWPTMTASP